MTNPLGGGSDHYTLPISANGLPSESITLGLAYFVSTVTPITYHHHGIRTRHLLEAK